MPTPVGPKKRKTPIGLDGFFNPVLALRIALEILWIAFSCPIINWPKLFGRFNNLLLSDSATLFTGIPVISETTSATCSEEISLALSFDSSFQDFWALLNASKSLRSLSLIIAASSNFCFETLISFFDLRDSICFSILIIFLGTLSLNMCERAPASSSISIALSGKNLSVIYLSDKWTQASIASLEYFTLWWSSYLSFKPMRISIDSLTEGELIIIFWNLLSSAPSFSICCLYSLRVVAPMQWRSPLAKEGLNILEASRDPEAPPAPTNVWSSSIKIIKFFRDSSSFIILFSLSSNWPLYLVPETNAARSRDRILLLCNNLGTVFWTIRWARPSIIAVLPTPGSPISTGLFFFLLAKTWATLSISFSRPITGSSLPFFANWVMSLEKWSKVGVFSSLLLSSIPYRSSPSEFSPSTNSQTVSKSRSSEFKTSKIIPSFSLSIARSKCSSSATLLLRDEASR